MLNFFFPFILEGNIESISTRRPHMGYRSADESRNRHYKTSLVVHEVMLAQKITCSSLKLMSVLRFEFVVYNKEYLIDL